MALKTFSLPPDTRAVGQGNPPADINSVVDAITALGALYNALNASNGGGADNTGGTDVSAAVNAAITAGMCLLPEGTFLLNSSTALALSVAGSSVRGLGSGLTTLKIGSSFSAADAISVTAADCSVEKLTIAGASSTVSSNPVCNAVEVTGVQRFRISDVTFQYINGWCLETQASGSSATYALQARGLIGLNCDGGIHAKSVTGVSWGGQHSYSDCNFQEMGAGSSGLDAVMFEDIEDIQCSNFNTSVSDASTASSMHIKGHCSTIYLANMDLGTYPNGSGTNYVWLIEDSTNGSPQDIRVVNGIGQQGTYGLRITGGATHLVFLNFRAFNNYEHGISVEGSGADINFNGVYCSANGQGASGTNYDINWSGTSTGILELVTLTSPVVSTGTAGVQSPAYFVPGNTAIARNWQCIGSGTTANNVFPSGADSPGTAQYVSPWSPRGSASVSVPSSGTATGKSGADRWFYVTANASGTTSVSVSGATAQSVSIAAGVTVPVFVPAGATLTPTYTSGDPPTWVVYAN